ncbi:MAG: hypothetical protein JJU06_15620 [Ectothiorhodospiraceae bacterium]|nr:hypothetical protein [Ectothiorhodospiraceae bacterium]
MSAVMQRPDWAITAAAYGIRHHLVKWATNAKSAIDRADAPHVSKHDPALANLAWFNLGLDGTQLLMPRSAGGISRLAVPLQTIHLASSAFSQAYAMHAALVDDKLSPHFKNARNDFKDRIDRSTIRFLDDRVIGRPVLEKLNELLSRHETIDELTRKSAREAEGQQQGWLQVNARQFATNVVEEARIFPNNTDLENWARDGFGAMLERIQKLFMASPLRPGVFDGSGVAQRARNMLANSPGASLRGRVMLVDGDWSREFATLGEADTYCLREGYTSTSLRQRIRRVFQGKGAMDCMESISGRRISSQEDFGFLLANGWLFEVHVKRSTLGAPSGVVVTHVALTPLDGAHRESLLKPISSLDSTLQALEQGYHAVMQRV